MTDCAIAAPATTSAASAARRATSRTARCRPAGVPAWLSLLGVIVMPAEPGSGATRPQGWIVSAGAGVGHMAAVFFDDELTAP
jgi:hypothetical protein